MSVGNTSRYNYSVLVQVVNSSGYLSEREHLDIRPTLTRTQHADNLQVVPTSSDTWSRVAHRMLGDGRHYWIIADYSGVIDPLSELKPEVKTKYLAQLTVDVPTGSVNKITVNTPKAVKRGMKIRVEDLDPGNRVIVELNVLYTNETTGEVSVTPFTSPGIPAALSRVSVLYEQGVNLSVPDIHRALFQALDFHNPLNTLTED